MARFGHSEKSLCLWLMSIVPILFMLYLGMPFFYRIALGIVAFISFFAIMWLPFQIYKLRLRPLLDETRPDETVWLRFTKDKIFIPQIVKKSTFGVTKGLIYGEKADVLDDGDFPVKTLNGNPAVIVYDIMNTTADLRKSLGRRFMKKRYGVTGGIDAYNMAIKDGKVMMDGRGKKES